MISTYTVDTLAAELTDLEARFGISSEAHHKLRYEDGWKDMQAAYGIPNFESHVWASTYRDWRRLAQEQR